MYALIDASSAVLDPRRLCSAHKGIPHFCGTRGCDTHFLESATAGAPELGLATCVSRGWTFSGKNVRMYKNDGWEGKVMRGKESSRNVEKCKKRVKKGGKKRV